MVFFFGSTDLLRYYFFRFADGLLPLLFLIGILGFGAELFAHCVLPRKWNTLLQLLPLGLIVPLWGLVQTATFDSKEFLGHHPIDSEMADWVRQNTPVDYVFFTAHNHPYWYFDYERPLFVSYKHAPQSARDLAE